MSRGLGRAQRAALELLESQDEPVTTTELAKALRIGERQARYVARSLEARGLAKVVKGSTGQKGVGEYGVRQTRLMPKGWFGEHPVPDGWTLLPAGTTIPWHPGYHWPEHDCIWRLAGMPTAGLWVWSMAAYRAYVVKSAAHTIQLRKLLGGQDTAIDFLRKIYDLPDLEMSEVTVPADGNLGDHKRNG